MENHSFKQTNILYLALLAGQILFAGVVFVLGGQEAEGPKEFGFDNLRMIIIVVLFSAIGAAYFIDNQLKGQIPGLSTIIEKLQHYRRRVIIRSALIEGANLFTLVAVLMEGSLNSFIFFGAGLAAFMFFRPTQDRFRQEYNISITEKFE